MEELSIEEKAKGYDDALERAKSAIKECGNNLGRIKMIESIFSDELWESEEEQTRKQLLDFVQRNTLASYSDRDKWVAYLEKLKDFDKKLEQAYKANNDEIFNYGYKAAKAELGEQDDEDPRWKYAYDLIIAEEMYQMSMNDEMVEEARTKAYEALCKIGHIGDLLHLENLKDFDKQLEEAYKTADEVQYKRGYGKGYVDGMADAKKKELEKQGEFPTTISVDKMVEEFERARIEANSICQIIETDAYRKGVVDTLSKILIKEEKPITIGSKKAEGKLGEMIAASKEPAESGEEDKQLTHKEVSKKSEQDGRWKWDEDDEKNLQGVIDEIQANKSSAPEYDLKTYDKFLSWLKSIKDRIQPHPKQVGWSEEDQDFFGMLEGYLEFDYDLSMNDKANTLDWLKSVKYRIQLQPKQDSRWKWEEDDEKFFKENILIGLGNIDSVSPELYSKIIDWINLIKKRLS